MVSLFKGDQMQTKCAWCELDFSPNERRCKSVVDSSLLLHRNCADEERKMIREETKDKQALRDRVFTWYDKFRMSNR